MELQAQFAFLEDWYRVGAARPLAAAYYVALRTALGSKPDLRAYLTRCVQCRIFFLTHPRNRGRRDLHCPFGCRPAHRRQRSAERSAAYYATPAGKAKKQQLNGARTRQRDVCELEEEIMRHRGRRRRKKRVPRPQGSEGQARGSEAAEEVRPPELDPMAFDSGLHEEPDDTRADDADLDNESEDGGLGVDEDMIEHIQLVTYLIEGRDVSRKEVLEMLERKWRQRSIGGEDQSGYGPGRQAEQEPP